MNRELQKNNPKLYDQYFEEIPRIFKSISSNFLVSATDMDIVEIDGKHFLQMVSSFYSPKYVDPLRTNKDPVTISESCTLVAELDENKKLTGSGVVISADSPGNLPTVIIVEHYNDGKAYYHSVSSADKTTFYNVADRSQISQALSIQRTWKDKNRFLQSILDNIDKYINPNQNDALAAKAYAAGKDFGKKEYSPEFVHEWQARQKQIKEETAQLKQDKEPEPEVFENDDYRIEYRTPYSESTGFDYKAFDKKNNTISELKVDVDEECYNIDGKCKLTFIEENTEPIYLQCMRPSKARREGDTIWGPRISEADKYKNEPEHIGGHREWNSKTNSYPYVKNIDDIMSIYRSLKKGDFEINTKQIYRDRDWGKRKDTVPSYTREQGIKKVLSFMDAYIFNTEESKELLVEYMQKYPIPLKNEETKDNPQVPAKEELKNYRSGIQGLQYLKNLRTKMAQFFSRGGKE